MIVWINGAFGSGKTTTAYELHRRLQDSFVYDPENVGYFLRRNTPGSFSKGDFQDIPLWREMNFQMLRLIAESYAGVVIVPMTLVNPAYFQEIPERLMTEGVEVRHFILYASREEIVRRLKKRSLPFFRRDRFAMNAIDRCQYAFDNQITDVRIDTEQLNTDEVVEKIAALSGLRLVRGRQSGLGKLIHRVRTAGLS